MKTKRKIGVKIPTNVTEAVKLLAPMICNQIHMIKTRGKWSVRILSENACWTLGYGESDKLNVAIHKAVSEMRKEKR